MSSNVTPHTPENWGAVARGYAELSPSMMGTYADDVLVRLDAQPNHEVLEVAAGTGAFTEKLASRAKNVLATDFSPGMLEVLKERLKAAGITNVQCEVMDGQALTVDDASFDRVLCCFGLMLFPDRAKGFSELRRVLRPGGRAVVTGWAGLDRFEAFSIMIEGMRSAFPEMPPPPGPPPVLSLADPDVFARLMSEAGFAEVDICFVNRTLEIPSFDELWRTMTMGAPPAKLMLERIGDEGKEHLRTTLAGIVKERYGDGPIRLKNSATVGTGVAG